MSYPWLPVEKPALPAPDDHDAQADVQSPEEAKRDLIVVDCHPVLHDDPAPERPPLLIIPGSGIPDVLPFAPRARRPMRMHAVIAIVAASVLLVAFLSVGPLSKAVARAANPFSALAASFNLPPPLNYFTYRVLPGDTFDRIAVHFGVTINGIFEMNRFYAGQEPQAGEIIRVPIDPHYGASYVPPSLPMANLGASIMPGDAPGNCLFCARGGWTNGPNGLCAAGGMQNTVTPTGFGLINPNPGSHWVRGFSWYHNGVDISTGVSGTSVVAAQDGQVIYATWDPFGGGYSVKVNHCGGLATSYSHLEKIFVRYGQPVHTGEAVGLQGSTGNSTGPHLHFMTWWNNVPFDPLCAYSAIDGVSSSAHYQGCPSPQHPPAGA
jgi:hypothetical protein